MCTRSNHLFVVVRLVCAKVLLYTELVGFVGGIKTPHIFWPLFNTPSRVEKLLGSAYSLVNYLVCVLFPDPACFSLAFFLCS